MRALLLVVLVGSCGGGDKPVVLPPTDQTQLLATLQDLSAMGQKQAGTAAGEQAATYVEQRFTDIGLSDVHRETYKFPRWELVSKSLTITIDGVPSTPAFDVFEAAGGGTVTGDIVDVGTASDLTGIDLTGKIALVRRDPSFHRSAQLRNVTAKGALAMLYLSVAPENLRQVGSVRFGWEPAGTIPAITVGADDGMVIKNAVTAGKTVRAAIDVKVTTSISTGQNIVGRIAGERPEMIILGAHYDTWFSGSSDNGSGVAELLAIADRRMQRGKPRYTLVFVGYDGEEIGLYGGYDYLRKHADDNIIAYLNLECPSAINPDIAAVVHSNQPKLDEALQKAHLRQIYGVYAGLEVVAQIFGGIIPTDIQGAYRSGHATVTTAVTNPYYHTVKDTPETVDLQLLADSSDAFDAAIDLIGKLAPADLRQPDPELWTADVTTSDGGSLFTIDVDVHDATGALQPNARVTADVLYDDFSLGATTTVTSDASGHAKLQVMTAATKMGSGNRFLHVTAGPTYPLVEKILALP